MEQKKKKSWDLRELFIIQICVALIAVLLIVRIGSTHEIETILLKSKHRIEMEELEQQKDSLQNELDDLHDLSWGNIDYWIDTLEIQHPEIVKQQIALETGMLTSAICQENSNLFGMKEPRVRETTALGTQRGHAFYHSYIDSIKDYKLWQDYSYVDGDYYSFLSRVGYAEARHYIAALKTI